jgi:hypothetical protein
VTADYVACLMRYNPDKLIGCFRRHYGTHVQKHILSIDDKCIEAAFRDQVDFYIAAGNASRAKNRPCIIPYKVLGFGVADNAKSMRRLRKQQKKPDKNKREYTYQSKAFLAIAATAMIAVILSNMAEIGCKGNITL